MTTRVIRLCTLIVICSASLLWGNMHRARAQEGGSQSAPQGSVTIHVVQRDETLFGIAMEYGTTVEAIADANGISDPRYIIVGQRLLIPNARSDTPGAIVSHRVVPGDSLLTLLETYHTSADSIAAANKITNPAQLYVGQEITVSQGAAPVGSIPRRLVHTEPGDNLMRVALRYNVSLRDLREANELISVTPLFAGQPLWIPSQDSASLVDLPQPIESYTMTPVPAVQGQTISIHISTQGPASLTGTFLGYPLQFITENTTEHYAMFGIHAFVEQGVYPLDLTLTTPDGQTVEHILHVQVEDGGYGVEDISLDTEQQDLLNPQVTEPEWETVAQTMSSFTSQRYFDGMMGLPSAGSITSEFGTRRAYNGGVLSTFHSGTDFGGAPGSPVVAPAAGVVVLVQNLPVRGNATIIDHGWGVLTGYWHQSEVYVSVGDVVTPGQTIGAVGTTGRSTGPHLHWEMWVGGVQVDPMQWVQERFP